MPTYEYRCKKCSHEFEEFQSITAGPIKICPECEGQVERLISAGNGLIFKGSGFYITDYKNSNRVSESESKKTEKSEKSEKPAKAEKKETKPAAKSIDEK